LISLLFSLYIHMRHIDTMPSSYNGHSSVIQDITVSGQLSAILTNQPIDPVPSREGSSDTLGGLEGVVD
jgi:hypothetical protein